MSEEPDRPEPEVVEAEVVPDDEAVTSESHSTELAPPVPQAAGVMMPFEAEEVGKAMEAYQKAVQTVLSESDWQDAGRGERFVKKSGWRKIAKAFGLSVTRVESGVERDSEGNPIRAWAVYRAAHANGQTQDGDGYCSVDEDRFANAGGRKKLENDMRATATTRAKNRAISDLVGMGEVSAEEVSMGGTEAAAAIPPYDGNLTPAWNQIASVVGVDPTVKLSDFVLKDNGGNVPMNVGRTIVAIGRLLESAFQPASEKAKQDAAAEAPDSPAPEPAAQAAPAEPQTLHQQPPADPEQHQPSDFPTQGPTPLDDATAAGGKYGEEPPF